MNRLTAISGFGVKGPACFLLETAGRRFLLDLGEGPEEGKRPDLAGVGRVDAILISHGHKDHVGALDLAADIGEPPIYATAPVRALSRQPRLSEARDLPLAGATEIFGLSVETGPVGHAPGGVWMRIGGEAGLVYTGDASDESLLFPFSLPPKAAALVFDASYGVESRPLSEQIAEIEALAAEKPLLLPAPEAGRALEMAAHFLTAGFEVSLCPKTREVAQVLAARPEALAPERRGWPGLLLSDCGELTPESPARGVMIAAAANVTRGTAAPLARRFAETGEARILFTGHMSPDSLPAAMVGRGEALIRRWNVHPTLGQIRRIFEAVAPRVALAAFVKPEGREALAGALAPWALSSEGRLEW